MSWFEDKANPGRVRIIDVLIAIALLCLSLAAWRVGFIAEPDVPRPSVLSANCFIIALLAMGGSVGMVAGRLLVGTNAGASQGSCVGALLFLCMPWLLLGIALVLGLQ